MLAADRIACVVYAAKSTEDIRGSIPDQLRDCRETLERAGDRVLVAEYSDEAFSAFLGDRGPGLEDAMAHAADLAREAGTAELWAQHSDRLARGDGRSARHAVEIALWALKRDVRVRTIQDPDTFRDLIYAVVTGQRNHEDSRRKGLASAAGRRRAAERGEYVGVKADGYRRVVEVDPEGRVARRLDIDTERQPALAMLFRLALRGRTSGQVARSLNAAGWQSKPRQAGRTPLPWDSTAVLRILHNPRYAGLSVNKGEIVGQGNWPAYITPRQHHRLQAMIADRWHRRLKHHEAERFLLSRLAKCGRCGEPLHGHTGLQRDDGSFCRRYLCRSHWRDRHDTQCDAPPLDADVVETIFAACLCRRLGALAAEEGPRAHAGELWAARLEHEQLRAAAKSGDHERLDEAIEQVVSRRIRESSPDRVVADAARGQQRATVASRLPRWAESRGIPPTVEIRRETAELNHILRASYAAVRIHTRAQEIEIAARVRRSPGDTIPLPGFEFSIDRHAWARGVSAAGRPARRQAKWSDQEILTSLRDWSNRHGRSPNSCEWLRGSPDRPGALCVRRRFGSWENALRKAGLKPNQRTQPRYWADAEILDAIRSWAERTGRPPTHKDWVRAATGRPCGRSVSQHFGTFGAAVAAAGFTA
jgi:hypothetical protein